MARKVGQWEEEEVAQSYEEEERHQPAMKRRCRVTGFSSSHEKASFKYMQYLSSPREHWYFTSVSEYVLKKS
ncbi:hypothetical protein STEG23_001038 [Scotinomys teguina]